MLAAQCPIRSNSPGRRLIVAFMVIAGIVIAHAATVFSADKSTIQYFEQLRQRRLFGLATAYCLARLADDGLSAGERADFTMELSRTHAAQAPFVSGEEQADLWRRAGDVISNLLMAESNHPRHALLETQRAYVAADHGRYLRDQLELYPDDEDLKSEANSTLERAIGLLVSAEQSLSMQLRDARKARSLEVPSPYELRTALLNVQYRVAAAYLDQAHVLPENSAQQLAALKTAEDHVQQILGGHPEESGTWRSRLILAECLRKRGELGRATQLLQTIEEADSPQQVRDELLAERIRLLLAEGNAADAADMLLDDRRTRDHPVPGQLQFLNVQALLRLWEVATDRQQVDLANQIWVRASEDVGRAEQQPGGYWGFRCRLLWERAREVHEYGQDIAALLQSGRSSYRNGRVEEAAADYGEAAAKALSRGHVEGAMEFGYTCGSLQLKSERYADAAQTFGELAARLPTHPRAASADLLAAYALGQVYFKDRTEQNLARYRDVLEAHRSRFADDPTTIEADWMLARLHESNGDYRAALELYEQIPLDHSRAVEAQSGLARCYERVLQQLKAEGEATEVFETEVLNRISRAVALFPKPPNVVDRQQADLLLRFSRLLLNQSPPQFERADDLLARVSESGRQVADTDKDESAKWQALVREASQLRVISLAGQRRFRDAESLLDPTTASPGELLGVLNGLTQLAHGREPQVAWDLGELQLRVAESLNKRRSELGAEDANRLDYLLAEAYTATRQPRQAVTIYESLLKRSPKDTKLVKTVATLLVECGSPACLTKAKQQWQRLESLENQGTDEWLEARYQVARCALMLGQHAECKKLLGVTRLLYPELGGGELQKGYEQLERDLNQRLR